MKKSSIALPPKRSAATMEKASQPARKTPSASAVGTDPRLLDAAAVAGAVALVPSPAAAAARSPAVAAACTRLVAAIAMPSAAAGSAREQALDARRVLGGVDARRRRSGEQHAQPDAVLER